MSDLLCCCCCVALLCCVGALLLALFVCLFVDKSNQRVRPARQECLFVCLFVCARDCVCVSCVCCVGVDGCVGASKEYRMSTHVGLCCEGWLGVHRGTPYAESSRHCIKQLTSSVGVEFSFAGSLLLQNAWKRTALATPCAAQLQGQ